LRRRPREPSAVWQAWQVAAMVAPLAGSALKAALASADALAAAPDSEQEGREQDCQLHAEPSERGQGQVLGDQTARFYNAHDNRHARPRSAESAAAKAALAWLHSARFLVTASRLDQLP
jgi:hypothetical protein